MANMGVAALPPEMTVNRPGSYEAVVLESRHECVCLNLSIVARLGFSRWDVSDRGESHHNCETEEMERGCRRRDVPENQAGQNGDADLQSFIDCPYTFY
jgi:hypothetical protein